MSEHFFIPPPWERPEDDGNLIDLETGRPLRDLPPDNTTPWVRGPDGTALSAWPHLEALRAHAARQQAEPPEWQGGWQPANESQIRPPVPSPSAPRQSNQQLQQPIQSIRRASDQPSYERHPQEYAPRSAKSTTPMWPFFGMIISLGATFVLFIGMANAGFGHKGGFGGWATGFVISLIATIVFTRVAANGS